jgi:phosphonate transport system ATP-binding protein
MKAGRNADLAAFGAWSSAAVSEFMSSSVAAPAAPGPLATSLVLARDVSKTFGARKALDSVSVSVAAGEMVALIGPSGSGKSTLLRSISGLQTIDAGAGTISVFGQTVQANGRVASTVRATRTRLGMIFQQFNLVGRLSLFSNVMLGALGRLPGWRGFFGLWPAADKARAMAAMHRVGVADYAAQRANTLSGGQQQRAAIARALVQGAEGILADEPVASLDPVSARKVMELLVELNRRDGLGVIVTLHQVDYAIRYCSRVIALKAGKVVYDGPSTGLDTKQLIDIYGPEFEDAFWEAKT